MERIKKDLVTVTIVFEREQLEKIDQLCEKMDLNRSQFARRAIENFLALVDEKPEPALRLE